MANPWHVITGPPSAGKSTIIKELSKKGYKTVEEMGRKLIEREMAQGKKLKQVNVDSPEFEQAWVKMQVETELKLDKNEQIFFDRGVIDTLAYFEYYNWSVPQQIRVACQKADYKKVFLLELLEFKDDGVRVESAETARKMQNLFGKVYRDAGYEVIFVPADTVPRRLELIVNHI